LFQTDAAAAAKARSPMVARTACGATSTDVDDERSQAHNNIRPTREKMSTNLLTSLQPVWSEKKLSEVGGV